MDVRKLPPFSDLSRKRKVTSFEYSLWPNGHGQAENYIDAIKRGDADEKSLLFYWYSAALSSGWFGLMTTWISSAAHSSVFGS